VSRARSLWLPFILCTLIWGSTWLAIKLQLTQVAPSWSVTYRFAAAALVLALLSLASKPGRSLGVQQHISMALQGFFQFCLNFMLVYESEHYIPSGLLAICFALMVLTNPLLARLLHGTKIASATLIGGSVAIIGVVLMFLPEIKQISWGDAATRGLLLGIGGMLAASVGNQFPAYRALKGVDARTMMLWAMAYGAAASALWAAYSAGAPHFSFDVQYLGALAFLVLFGSCLAFTLYYGMIQRHGVTIAAYTGVFIPVVALAWSTLFENYHWGWLNILGGLVALAGTVMAQRRPATPKSKGF
jgi:drug/metabolite transporter (DMT)-like permease